MPKRSLLGSSRCCGDGCGYFPWACFGCAAFLSVLVVRCLLRCVRWNRFYGHCCFSHFTSTLLLVLVLVWMLVLVLMYSPHTESTPNPVSRPSLWFCGCPSCCCSCCGCVCGCPLCWSLPSVRCCSRWSSKTGLVTPLRSWLGFHFSKVHTQTHTNTHTHSRKCWVVHFRRLADSCWR